MLATEKSLPQRRLIADRLHKLIDDERLSDDIFALTMNLFDRFIRQTNNLPQMYEDDRYCQLIALSCYTIAKKLRSTTSINNENEKIELIYHQAKYRDDEIFDAEQTIAETLDWDLSTTVPHDYIDLLFKNDLFSTDDQRKLRLHLHLLLSLTLCEMNTLTYSPKFLVYTCFTAVLKGLRFTLPSTLDQFFVETMNCDRIELMQSQFLIEQLFQSYLHEFRPRSSRRCLAPIESSSQQQQQKQSFTRVK